MHLYLVHHGHAVGPEIDARRPLSDYGRHDVERLASAAAARGVKPGLIWHSGKLRAKQTAELFWRACNALAPLTAERDLQPDDPAERMRDRLRGETEDVLIAGHFFHLPRLLGLLTSEAGSTFPQHGMVALVSGDGGASWREDWRLAKG